jgi:hypothetical protein
MALASLLLVTHHSVKSTKSWPLDTGEESWTVSAMAYTRFEWEKAIGECAELSANAHHVALTLGNWIHSHRLVGFVVQEDIARRMKRSRKHLNRGLNELEASGWIQRTPGTKGRATVYRAVIPAAQLTKDEDPTDPRSMALDFVHELCRFAGYEWWNDTEYQKKLAPLLAVLEDDFTSGLLDCRRQVAFEWCARPLPSATKTLSGLFYSRYVEWRGGYVRR